MGLDITHGCWSGAYSRFDRFRRRLAEIAGFPPLNSMEGHGGNLRWGELKQRPLIHLLHHSDCDGDLVWGICKDLADDMESLLALFNEAENPDDKDWILRQTRFIEGLRLAYSKKENVEFE